MHTEFVLNFFFSSFLNSRLFTTTQSINLNKYLKIIQNYILELKHKFYSFIIYIYNNKSNIIVEIHSKNLHWLF